MRLRLFLAVVILGLAFGVAAAPPASACSCVGGSDADALARADVVFVGDISDVSGPGPFASDAVWTFSVRAVFKGDAAEEQAVVTAAESAACGLELPRTGPVLIFATRPPAGQGSAADRAALHSGLCSGSRPWTGEAVAATSVVPHPVGSDAPVAAPLGDPRPPIAGAAGVPASGAWRLYGGAAVVLAAVVAGAVVLVRRLPRKTS